ncbi:hypothetical protein FRC09_003639, partial [Ceratobasidium sp. 395]
MPSTSRAVKPAASKSRTNNLDQVTSDLANLKIQSKSTKHIPEDIVATPSETLRNAMIEVNEASKSISVAVKLGWKLGSTTAVELDWSEAKVNKIMEPVEAALSTLRLVYQEQGNLAKIVDVERAALGVVAKLNTLQMYKLSLGLLEGVRLSMLSLLGAPEAKEPRPKSRSAKSTQRPPSRTGTSKEPYSPYLALLLLPQLPESSSFNDPATIQSLSVALATYQAHAVKSILATLDNTQLHDLYKTLISPEFLLTRAPPRPGTLPVDQLSALFVGAFQSIAGSPALSPQPTPEPLSSSANPKAPSARAPSATRARTRSASASGATRAPAPTSAKAAAKSTVAVPPNVDELGLLCRKQALLLLAHSPSIEKDINLFWDQATKWAAVYVKSVSALSSPPTEQQIGQTLSAFFSDLIAVIPPERQCGPRFEALCEWWMRFAKKVKDVESVQKITYLLHPPSTPERPARENQMEPPPIAKTKSSSATNSSRAAVLATLDRAALAAALGDMYAASEALDMLDSGWFTVDDVSIGRLVNTVSELRKACVKCWTGETEDGKEEGRKGAVRAVVDGMAKCAEKPGFPHEITVSAIDALLTLSRFELNPQDYESYSRANLAVDRALKLAELAGTRHGAANHDSTSPHLSFKTQATLLRAVSNSSYTLAGVLYNANLAAKGITFAEQACKVGERALGLVDLDITSDKELSALKAHMPRRWELLAVCRLKAADRQGAAQAFGRALVKSVELAGPKQILDDKTGQLIEQLVRVSVGELFDPDAVILSRLFANAQVDTRMLSAMMEKVIGVLEDMMHKPIAQRAMQVATQEMMRLWGDKHPIKKAKLMIGLLEQEYRSNTPSSSVSHDEILELLSSEDLYDDTPLKPHVSQYLVQTHIWTALILHKSNAPVAEVAQHATLASNELLAILAPPETHVTAKSAGKKPATGRRGAVAKRGARGGDSSSAASPAKKLNIPLEDPARVVQAMDMLAQVLGLLGHTFLKLQFLHSIMWICEECSGAGTAEAHVRTSVDLSNVYLDLGQVENATDILETANKIAESNSPRIDTSTLVMLRLLYADLLARSQQTEQSVKMYKAAFDLSEQIEATDKHAAYMVKTQARLQALQRSALACGVYASIQSSMDDTVSMLAGLTQALRLWNRAVDILLRLSEKTQPAPPAEPANPFEVRDSKSATLDEASQAKKTVPRAAILDGIQWQIAQLIPAMKGLLRTIFDLAEAYSVRGSVREAEFFVGQAHALSESLQAPLGVGRSLIKQAELKMARGLLDEGLEMLAKAEDIVTDPVGVDAAALHCFLGHHRQREASAEDAYAMYVQADKILDQLGMSLAGLRRRQIVSKDTPEALVPEVRGLILKEQIWLSQIGVVQPEDQVSMDELNKLPQTPKLKSETASLLGRIALYEVFNQFRSDLFLGSLTESAVAVPMGIAAKESTTILLASTRDALNSLGVAEQNFWKTLQLSVSRGDATHTREAATNLARILSFQSSLGRQGIEGAVLTATLL